VSDPPLGRRNDDQFTLLTAAEQLQYEGYLHREETNSSFMAIAKSGVSIKEIVRQIRHSRGLVHRILRGDRSDVFRVREAIFRGWTSNEQRDAATALNSGDA
jgi:hypothetical protein